MSVAFLVLLIFPFLALAQSNSSSQGNSFITPSSTAFTTIASTTVLSSGGFLSTRVFTTVQPLTTATSTNSTNATTSLTKSTSSSPVPTAPTDVNGGGLGGAPVPGATSTGGGVVYGPDDGYIAAASTISKNAFAASLVASLVGGALAVL